MLFRQEFWPGIASGAITTAFRRWKRPTVLPGRRYRTPAGRIQVESIAPVEQSTLSQSDVEASGFPSHATLLADLAGEPGDGRTLYRITFHLVDEPDPRDELAATVELDEEDRAAIAARLDRLDRASASGPWTRNTLDAIAYNPGLRASDLAISLGRDRDAFKRDVRKLKALGLTRSLEVGYQLSPRGEAFRSAPGQIPGPSTSP